MNEHTSKIWLTVVVRTSKKCVQYSYYAVSFESYYLSRRVSPTKQIMCSLPYCIKVFDIQQYFCKEKESLFSNYFELVDQHFICGFFVHAFSLIILASPVDASNFP